MVPVVVDAGEVVFRVHEVAREAFVILKGVVEIKTGERERASNRHVITMPPYYPYSFAIAVYHLWPRFVIF